MKTEKSCQNCEYYKPYFRKGIISFWKENCGNCEKHAKAVDGRGMCGNYIKAIERRVTLSDIDRATEHVKALLAFPFEE